MTKGILRKFIGSCLFSVLLCFWINMILSFLVVDGISIVYINHIYFYEVAMLASFFITNFAMMHARRITMKKVLLTVIGKL